MGIETGKGIIIIKSHAITEGISDDIFTLLEKKQCCGTLKDFPIDRIKDDLEKIKINNYKSINIPIDSNFFNIVYPKDVNEPFFPILKELYSGNNIVISLLYNGTQSELQKVLLKIKGRGTILNDNGEVIRQGYGIRGHILKPNRYISDELLSLLSPNDYFIEIKKLLNNIIHTTDSIEDYKRLSIYIN